MQKNSGSHLFVSRNSKPSKQSASDLSRTQKFCSYDFGPMITGKWTTPFTSMGNPFAALSSLGHGFRSSLWVCFNSSKVKGLRRETLPPQSQTAPVCCSQFFISIKILRVSTTELRVILVCGHFLKILLARRPVGVNLLSLKYLFSGCGTHDENFQLSSKKNKFCILWRYD